MIKALFRKILNALTNIGKEVKTPPPIIQPPSQGNGTGQVPPPDSVDTVQLKWGTMKLPLRGRFVIESHYATKTETFINGFDHTPFPRSSSDKIKEHMFASAEYFFRSFPNLAKKFKDKTAFVDAVYNQSFEKVWTPANDGGTNFFGQGARGNMKPTVEEEMWQANMMFTKLVPAGTKFKLRNPKNGKEVIVQMGYEIGPGSKSYLGGAVPEVHWWLESNNSTELELLPVSQSAALGPVEVTVPEKPDTPTPEPVNPSKLPTRSEVSAFIESLLNTRYNGMKETQGKNRSPELDALIKRQGGALGEPYCLYGIQDVLDEVRKKFNVTIDLPEGGSTQSFWEGVKKEYKTQTPATCQVGIYRKGETWSGHAVMPMSGANESGVYRTFEFNTNLNATMLERDGEGCGFRTRNTKGYIGYNLRGFVDIYKAMKAKE